MMAVGLVCFLTICLVIVTYSPIDANDPCLTSNRLNDWRRSVNYKVLYTDPNIVCDSQLNGWYRITSCAGSMMPTSCLNNALSCNTHAPIWLTSDNIGRENVYPVNGATVTRQYCASWDGNCCHWTGNIQIKDCTGYYVYYLTETPTCTLAYCFGDKVPSDLTVSYTASTEDPGGCIGFRGNGNWTEWTPWTECTKSCGGGTTSRNRTCISPNMDYSFNCTGHDSDETTCNMHYCPIDGNWTDWTPWMTCSVSCGGGTRSRNRTCTHPKPDYGGLNCTGDDTDDTLCNTHHCPIDGNWTDWTPWTSCSVSCGGGTTSRNRTCTNPRSDYGGLNCTGNDSDKTSCNMHNCPVDGNWTDWTPWTTCSLSCGGGTTSRDRTCTNPRPDYGGLNCTGNDSDKTSCNMHNCPVDGNWTGWASWMTCSVSCGGGNTSRNRTCTSPRPDYGGLNCTGNDSDKTSCNTHNCPVDGNWTDWTPWTTCSVSCGGGTTTRNRTCTNPRPDYGGLNCTGDDTDDTLCNTHYCPIDGNWTDWTPWMTCSVSCGGGTTSRNRTCTNPKPDYGGLNCTGNDSDKTSCNMLNCPVDGNWTDWTPWTSCSVSCGGGTTSRNRTCTNPKPDYGGLNCTGNDSDEISCNIDNCPGKFKHKCPTCTNPKRLGGLNCAGNDTDYKHCISCRIS